MEQSKRVTLEEFIDSMEKLNAEQLENWISLMREHKKEYNESAQGFADNLIQYAQRLLKSCQTTTAPIKEVV